MRTSTLTSVALVGLLAALAAGCGRKPVPIDDPGPEENAVKPNPKDGDDFKDSTPPPLGKTQVSLDAAKWHEEFKKDSDAALAKYKDKVVELSGVVARVSDDPDDAGGNVFLDVPAETIGIHCATTDKKPWVKVSPGSKVKIRGRAGEMGDLHAAQIVEAGPNPGVVISAEKLIQQFLTNRKATKEKYDDKYAYVDGEVVEKTEKEGSVTLKLKGEKNILVACNFGSSSNKKELAKARPGQKAKVFGQFSLFDGDKDTVIYLNTCLLTELK
jgi:hypothetical protein